MIGVVYYWKNKINGRHYIGSTAAPKGRFNSHIRNSTNVQLREDMISMGITAFEYGVYEFLELSDGLTKSEIRRVLWDMELHFFRIYLIEDGKLKPNAYNVNPHPAGNGRIFTAETKVKMSESGKKKKLSSEHKRRIGQNHCSKNPDWVSPHKGKPMNIKVKQRFENNVQGSKKRILQYNLDGEFVAEYPNIAAAGKFLGAYPANISKCVSGINKTYYGFIWKPYQENFPTKIKISRPPRILMYDLDMQKVGEFDNTFSIEKQVGIHHTNVSKAIRNGRATVGYYFEYEQL